MIATSQIKKITLPGDTPKCDLCVMLGSTPQNDAEFDMPTTTGPWAYVCRDHLESHVKVGAYEIGTHITWTG
jgi:hypothetical protein